MTLTSIYEESNRKEAQQIVRVAGLPIQVYSLQVTQQFGVTNSARFDIPNPVPATFAPETPVEIYLGYDGFSQLVFSGAIVTPTPRADGVTIECAGEGRKLTRVYKRIVEIITSQDINDVIEGWLTAAGVTNFVVDLPARQVGAIVPYVAEFTTYGDAINQLSMIDGDPWYETPTGQIRVELKDPWPAPSPRRRYFSGDLVNLTASQRMQAVAGTLPAVDLQPAILQGVVTAEAKPRIRFGIGQTTLLQNVKNRVFVQGAMLDVPDGGGGTTSQRIEAQAQAASPFITTPPQFKDVSFDFPAIDTQAWANEIAFRYTLKVNRLEQQVALQVDGDPEVQLGMTVQVEDPQYTRVTGNWFVYGLSHQFNGQDFMTTYDLRGGVGSGTTPLLNPVADFIYGNEYAQTAKIKQVVPATNAAVIVTFDGRSSFDPDGTIVSWDWADDQGNTGSGSVIQFAYPEAVSTVLMTLTVTDNDGLTDSLTKSLNIGTSADSCGDAGRCVIFAAIKTHMSVSEDGGETWTDVSKAAAAATGDFIAVAHNARYIAPPAGSLVGNPGDIVGMFGTSTGELYRTTDFLGSTTKFQIASGRPIVGIFCLNPQPYSMDWWAIADDSGNVYILVIRLENDDYGGPNLYYSDGKPTVSASLFLQGGNVQQPDVGGVVVPLNQLLEIQLSGGNSSDPDTMFRPANGSLDSQTSVGGTFFWAIGSIPLNRIPPITGALRAAILAAGAGHTGQAIAGYVSPGMGHLSNDISAARVGVMFTSGVDPRVWFWDGSAWSPATGLTPATNGQFLATGFDQDFLLAVLAQLKTFSADDGVTFVEGTTGAPSQIRHVVWELGLLDVYLGAADDGIVKSLDGGDTWGYIRPHAGVGTTWPAGADGKQVAIAFTPPTPCANIYSLAVGQGGTLILSVAGNDDDAVERQDSTGFDKDEDLVSAISNNVGAAFRQDVGLRFADVPIPQGAVLSSVVLEIYIEAGDNFDDAREHIFAEDIDDSPDFAATPSVMSRTNTTANVAWDASNIGTGAYFPSPDITAVIQEVIDRPGWVSGNALTVLLRGDASGTSRTLRFMAKEHADNHPARLNITYDTAGGQLLRLAGTWQLVDNTRPSSLFGLRYFGDGHALHLDDGDVPKVSSDYGVSWSDATPPTGGGSYDRCKAATIDSAGERAWSIWTNTDTGGGIAICYSLDFGATWVVSEEISGATTFVTDIACHPAEPNRIAAVGAIAGDATVWVSVDRGVTWTARTGPALGNAITYQPLTTGASAYIVWTPYGRLIISTGGRLATADGDLYYSDDLGVNWTKSTVPSPAPNRNWNVQLFRIGGFGPYFMLYGDEASGAAASALLRSDNHGVSWVNVLTPTTSEFFAGIEYDPLSDTLLLSTPSHVYGLNPAASDDASDWSDITANFYSLALTGQYVFQPFAFIGDPASA